MTRKKGTNKESRWSSKGGGMSKHRKSGASHNQANTIARVREVNKELEKENNLKKKRKGKMVGSVKDLFDNFN